MKAIVLILAIAFVSVHCDEESSSSSEEIPWGTLSDIVESKYNITILADVLELVNKTVSTCPDIEEKFQKAVDDVDTCLDGLEMTSTDTFCSLARKNFVTCAEPARKAVVECLPPESQDIPGLVVKMLNAIIDQACSSTVEQILELFNPCKFEDEFTSHDVCSKVKDIFVENTNKLPTKSLICKTMPKVNACIKAHEEASCKNPVTKQASLQFFNAIEKATESDCAEANKIK